MLSDHEQEEILGVMAKNMRSISESKPNSLARLQRDIELVKLEGLIARFEEMMTKQLNESEWQLFFDQNPFVLSMAFGYPVIKVKERASVGGSRVEV